MTARPRVTPAQWQARTTRALDMLRAGATAQTVRRETRLSLNSIADLRKEHRIPIPARASRTLAEGLALYTEAFGDGHLHWTGPWRGRSPLLYANNGRHNVRHVIFRRRHGCAPIGYVRTTCTAPGCVADDHLADDISNTSPAISQAAAITYLLSRGASDWQIACHLGASAQAINRIRTQLKDTAHAR